MRKIQLFSFLAISALFSGCVGVNSNSAIWESNGLYFEYPEYLTISLDPRSDANIIVQVEPVSDFVQNCVDVRKSLDPEISEYSLNEQYRETILSLREEGLSVELEDFDNVSCGLTMGNIRSDSHTVNDYNAVIYQKAFAQDVGSMTVFHTQLLFVDKYDQVYSLLFDYNFANNKTYIDEFRDEYGGAYNPKDTAAYPDSPLWDEVYNFFAYEAPIKKEELTGFSENKEVIEKIIDSVKLNSK